MPTVDVHTHILPKTWPDWSQLFGYDGFIHLEHLPNGNARMMRGQQFFREIGPDCWDPEVRLARCDELGIDVQVICTVPVMFSYWAKPEDTLTVARFLNDHLADLTQRYPKRLVPLGTLPMQAPDLAIAELERIHEMGFPGVQIGSHINQWELHSEQLEPFFAAAEDLDMAIMVHPWEMVGRERMPAYWLPWLVGMPAETCLAICNLIFGGVFERHPRLKVLFAHGGGSFPATVGRIQHGFEVRPDLCAVDNPVSPKEYLERGSIWVDSIVHDANALDYLIKIVGPHRIALGSDYPFPLGELEPGELIRRHVDDAAVRQQLLGATAFDWLGLNPKDYV